MPQTWREKLDKPAAEKIVTMDKPKLGAQAGQTMLITTPKKLDQALNQLKTGEHTDLKELRTRMASQAGADVACPLVTGIFTRIAAEVALEELAEGKPQDQVTPFWRAVNPKSPLAKKISCGPDWIAQMRTIESQ